jgi:hypothetical protein
VKKLLVLVLASCAGDIDAQWQLAHERIIAVRATPPHILAGTTSVLDVFVGHVGSGVQVEPPSDAEVLSPISLTGIIGNDNATVTAPGETELDQVRGDLGLGSDDPVPVEIQITADGFQALKTVYIGDSADNPTFTNMMIDGSAAPDPSASVIVPLDTDVPLSIDDDPTNFNINWLTSCGTMNDFDLNDAFVNVAPTDTQTGQLGIVMRDQSGGVVWAYWAMATQQ